MPTPYEPVIRHEWPTFASVCTACMTQMAYAPCRKDWCRCVCNGMPEEVTLRPPVEEDGPPHWDDPPAKPEPIETWKPNADFIDKEQARAAEKAVMNLDALYRANQQNSHNKSRVKEFITKWEVPFAIGAVILYAVAVILLFVVFPDVSNTWVAALVLVSGLLTSLSALASVLKTRGGES